MCVCFYSSFVCISAYANVYFKTIIIKQNIKIILIAGVPSSQALPGFLLTAPPTVCVPDVIGALARGFQTQKKKRLISNAGVSPFIFPCFFLHKHVLEDSKDLGTTTSKKSYHHLILSPMRPDELWPNDGAAREQAPGCQRSSCGSVRRGSQGGGWGSGHPKVINLLTRGNLGTVTIPQYRANKTKQHTHVIDDGC